jgi:dTDP-4-dehydrorhamnose 3,5-epimerase
VSALSEVHRPGVPPPTLIETAIEGVRLLRLSSARDARGAVTESCRFEWLAPVELPQWNVVTSRAGVMRGMHWHNLHHDFISPAHGVLLMGLADLRRGSPTEGACELLELDASRPAGALVPPGVAHGLFSAGPTVTLYAVSRYWDPEDERGVAFDDPALGVPWLVSRAEVMLSERDRGLPPLSAAGPLPEWRDAAA